MTEKKHFEDHPGYEKLDDRERQVLGYLAEGKSSKEIAFFIICTVRTVDTYRMNIMDKLGLEDPKDLLLDGQAINAKGEKLK